MYIYIYTYVTHSSFHKGSSPQIGRVMNLHKKCIHSKLRSKLAFENVSHVVDERVAHGSFHRGGSPQIGTTPLIAVYRVAVCCGVLRCVAVSCSELQCVAVCCSVLQ